MTPTRPRLSTTMLVLGAAALLYFGRKHPPVSRFSVEGASMEPAYGDGDRVLVNRLAYRLRSPREGDVVVLRDPERPEKHLLKRVAAGPEGANDPWAVYVLGDNVDASRDSRAFGAVPAEAIVGKAWFTY